MSTWRRSIHAISVPLTSALVATLLVLAVAESPTAATFPGDNGTLVLGGDNGISTLAAEGGGLTPVISGGTLAPAVAPDGETIAYVHYDLTDAPHEIWTVGLDGSDPQLLHLDANNYAITDVAWSSDGTKLAYISIERDDLQCQVVKVLDLLTGVASVVSQRQYIFDDVEVCRFFESRVEWSPTDPNVLLYNVADFWDGEGAYEYEEIVRLDLATGVETKLTAGLHDPSYDRVEGNNRYVHSFIHPTWSPSGDEIAFVHRLGTGEAYLAKMPVDGSALHRVSENTTLGMSFPAWSPDGTTIAYMSDQTDIWLVNADGDPEPRRIQGDGPPGVGIWDVTWATAAAPPPPPGTLIVDTTDDDLARSACTSAPSDCSLRGAVSNANADANTEVETIIVPAGTYALSATGPDIAGGSLDVSWSTTIQGAGSGQTIIDALGDDRAFVLWRGAGSNSERVVHLSGMTVRNGSTCGTAYAGSGSGGSFGGGAIFIGALATLDDVVVEDSTSCTAAGGGIALLGGSLDLSSSAVRRSTASTGAGIYSNGSLTVTDSTVDGNTSTDGGGGLFVAGTVLIDRSTISNNTARASGGGISSGDDTTSACCAATVTLRNSTVSGNLAKAWTSGTPQPFPGTGGGIYAKRSSYTIQNSTITNNTAQTHPSTGNPGVGGGITTTASSPFTITSSIIAGNHAAQDCWLGEGPTSTSHSVACTSTDPELGPLGDNGGPTSTHLPLDGSPAIDAGDDGTCEPTDQRGTARPQGSGCDAGSVEVGVTVVPALSVADASASEGAGTITFDVTLSAPSETPVEVAVTTSDGSATAPADYVEVDDVVTFAPGETTTSVEVTVEDDQLDESDETFALDLSAPSGATITDGHAAGTITDDDALACGRELTIASYRDRAYLDGDRIVLTRAEDSQAATVFTTDKVQLPADGSFSTDFRATFSGQAGGGADGIVFVLQNVDDAPALPGGGYLSYYGLESSLGIELDTFDNGAGPVFFDGNGSHVAIDQDGTFGSGAVALPYDLDAAGTSHVWIEYDGATDVLQVRVAPTDVRPATPTLTATVDLPAILGGTEAYIGFTAGAGNAYAAQEVSDWNLTPCEDTTDVATVSVSDAEADEGDGSITFDVTLSAPAEAEIQLDVDTVDGTATTPDDYSAVSDVVTFAAGDTTETVTVTLVDDEDDEPDETFALDLSAPSGATIADGHAVGTITDDDPPAGACVTWDGGADTTSWSDVENWSTDAAPGATDDVCIPDGVGFVEHDVGVSVVASLTVDPATDLYVSGDSLTVTGATVAGAVFVTNGELVLDGESAIGDLSIDLGSVGGAGDVELGGLLWDSGAMTGSGVTTTSATSLSHLGGGSKALGRSLVLGGEVTWQSGSISTLAGGSLTVAGSVEVFADVSAPPTTVSGELHLREGVDLTVVGDLTLLPTATLGVSVGVLGTGRASATEHVAIDGTLAIKTIAPFAPTSGEFSYLASATRDGGFDSVTGRNIGNGYRYRLGFGDFDLLLIVEPAPSSSTSELADITGPAWDAVIDWLSAFDLDGFDMAQLGLPDFELPVVTDDLASLFDLPAAAGGAENPFPALEGSDAEIVEALEDAGIVIDWVVGGIGDAPEPTSPGDIIQVHTGDVLLGNLAAALGFTGDEHNDELTGVLAGLADALGLDGALSPTADLTVNLVLGVDADGPYIGAGTTLRLELSADGTIAGTADIGGVSGASVSGTGDADLDIVLVPATGGRVRLAQLAEDPFELLRPSATGTANLALDTDIGPIDLTWAADLTASMSAGATTVDIDATVDGTIGLPGLTAADGTTPASVAVHGTTDGSTWSLTGSTASLLLLHGFSVDDVSLGATIGPDVLDGSGAATLHADLGDAALDTDVTLAGSFDADSYHLGGSLDIAGPLEIPDLAELTGIGVDASFDGTIPAGSLTGEVSVDIDTLTLLDGTIAATGVSGSVDAAGTLRLGVDSVEGDLAGLIHFQTDPVSVVIGDDADEPILSVPGVLTASIPDLGNLVVKITDLRIDQDGAVSAQLVNVITDGVFATIGIAGMLPFDIHGFELAFPEVGGRRLLDTFTLAVCGAFDQDALDALPFDMEVSVGGTDAGPSCPDLPDPIAFSVAVDSLVDGDFRPYDLGPIAVGVSNIDVGLTTLGGSLTIAGYDDGVLSPTFGGSLDATGGPPALSSASFDVTGTFDSLIEPTHVDIAGTFTASGALSDVVSISNASVSFALGIGIGTGATPTVDELTLTGGTASKVTIELLDAVSIVGTGFDVHFDAGPDEELVHFDTLAVSFPTGESAFSGWSGTATDFGLTGGFEPTLGPDFGLTITPAANARFGLPDWIPLTVGTVGIRFNGVDLSSIPPSPDWDDLKFILIVSGGLTITPQWPIAAEVHELEIDLDRLLHPELGFPILNVAGAGGGFAPFELVPGFRIGGQLALDFAEIGGQRVFYARLAADFEFEGIGAGIDIIVSQYGPVLSKLRVPLAVPLGPTGLILTGVKGGVRFGVDALPVVESPIELLHEPAYDLDFPMTSGAITTALTDAVTDEELTWSNGFQLTLGGTFTHIAAPSFATGDVVLGMNVALGEATPVVQLIGQGDVSFYGMPFADAALMLDFTDPIAPQLDLAFEAPSVGNPLGFVLPAHETFEVHLDTAGVVSGIALGTRKFFDKMVDGSTVVGRALYTDALASLATSLEAQRLKANAANAAPSTLVELLLDVNNDTNLSATERTRTITSSFISTRVRGGTGVSALLPVTGVIPGNLTYAADAIPALLAGLFDEAGQLLAGGGYTFTGGDAGMAALTALLGTGTEAVASFVDISRDALLAGGTAFYNTINPVFHLKGKLQPIILGIPFGQPEQAVELLITKDGLSFGFDADLTAILENVIKLVDPLGILATGLFIMTLGFDTQIGADVELPISGIIPMLLGAQAFPAIDPLNGAWGVRITGGIQFLDFGTLQLSGLAVPRANAPFVDAKVQKMWLNPMAPLDPLRIPIQTEAHYSSLIAHGGLLLSGRLLVPKLATDPVGLLAPLGLLPPTSPTQIPQWIANAVQTFDDVDQPAIVQAYIPGFTEVSTPSFTTYTDEHQRNGFTRGGLSVDAYRAKLNAILQSAYFEGTFDGRILSMPTVRGSLRATTTGLRVDAFLPGTGLVAGFDLGHRDVVVGGVHHQLPTVASNVTFDSTKIPSLVAMLKLPTVVAPNTSAGATFRAYSPAFDPTSSDTLLSLGGIELSAKLNIGTIVQGAQFKARLTPRNDPLLPFDVSASASVGTFTPIPGVTLTNGTVGFDRIGTTFDGRIGGTLTLPAWLTQATGLSTMSVLGKFTGNGGSVTLEVTIGTKKFNVLDLVNANAAAAAAILVQLGKDAAAVGNALMTSFALTVGSAATFLAAHFTPAAIGDWVMTKAGQTVQTATTILKNAFVAAGGAFTAISDWVLTKMTNVATKVQDAATILAAVFGGVGTAAFTLVSDWVLSKMTVLATRVQDAATILKNVFGTAATAFTAVGDWVLTKMQTLATKVQDAAAILKNVFGGVGSAAFTLVADWVLSKMTVLATRVQDAATILKNVFGTAATAFTAVADWVRTKMTNAATIVQDAALILKSAFGTGMFTSIADWVRSKVTGATTAAIVQSAVAILQAVFGGIGSTFFNQIGDWARLQLPSVQDAALVLKNVFGTGATAFTAVADWVRTKMTTLATAVQDAAIILRNVFGSVGTEFFTSISNWVRSKVATVQDAALVLKVVFGTGTAAFNAVAEWVRSKMTTLATAVQDAAIILRNVFGSVGTEFFTSISNWVRSKVATVQDAAAVLKVVFGTGTAAFNAIAEWVYSKVTTITTKVQDAANILKTVFGGVGTSFFVPIANWVQGKVAGAVESAATILKAVVGTGTSAFNAIADWVRSKMTSSTLTKDAASILKNVFGTGSTAVTNLANWVYGRLGSVQSAAQVLKDIAISSTAVMQWIDGLSGWTLGESVGLMEDIGYSATTIGNILQNTYGKLYSDAVSLFVGIFSLSEIIAGVVGAFQVGYDALFAELIKFFSVTSVIAALDAFF